MKNHLIIILLLVLTSLISYSQETIHQWSEFDKLMTYGFDDIRSYNLIGKVKEVVVLEISTIKRKSDSDSKTTHNYTKTEFNRNGQLLKEYTLEKDDSYFLEVENTYNAYNQIIHKKEIDKKFGSIGYGFKGYLKGIHIQETKYSYDSNNNLTHTYFKSSYQDRFFLKKRNTYNSNQLLIKKESLNNHMPDDVYFYATCKGSGNSLQSFTTEYFYNSDNLNTLIKSYKNNSIRYKKDTINGQIITTPIILEENIDFSNMLELNYKISNRYNSKKQLHISESEQYYTSNNIVKNTVIYEYDKFGKVSQTKRLKDSILTFGTFREHQIINNNLEIETEGYLKDVNNVIERIITHEIIHQKDGTIKRINYNNNSISSTQLFDSNYNLIEENSKTHQKKVKYIYDKNNNWVVKKATLNGKLTEHFIRTITYFD